MYNIIPFKIYQLVRIRGQLRVACLVGSTWKLDETCESMNELLDLGMMDPDSVQAWVDWTNSGESIPKVVEPHEPLPWFQSSALHPSLSVGSENNQ